MLKIFTLSYIATTVCTNAFKGGGVMSEANNMKVWNSVSRTDPKYTKKGDTFNNYLTSINGTYLIKEATRIFGMMGIGFGFKILEERYDQGCPLKSKDGIDFFELTHTLKIELWFKYGEEFGRVVNFGHTKYIYKTKNGYMTDSEAPKKSLTDAIKKCLSMIGFASDIHMGQFEDKEYFEELKMESDIEHADDKDAERVKQVKEHQDWLNSELKCYPLIDDLKALKTVNTGHLRKANRRKDVDGMEKFKNAYENRVNEINKSIKAVKNGN